MNQNSRTMIRYIALLSIFIVAPLTRAVTPAPDGGYAGDNTAEGDSALLSLTSGIDNTALGSNSLRVDTVGSYNTATGFRALFANASGTQNTANGVNALLRNTSASYNTATGTSALFSNTTGSNNTAFGWRALFSNATTGFNTAIGSQALYFNTGSGNTSTGYQSLYGNTVGTNNTAFGSQALSMNSNGSNNIGLGYHAGANVTSGSNNIHIGNGGLPNDDATIRIGNPSQTTCYISGIFGSTEASTPVYINSSGHLGVPSSSVRFKRDIKPMDRASESILSLKPVTFQYKSDKNETPRYGLIAEQVAEVNPDLVIRDEKGEIYTVRYDAVNAMLLNEFLKAHEKIEAQEKANAELRSTIARQEKAIEALAAQMQKVSAQVELNRAANRMANNR